MASGFVGPCPLLSQDSILQEQMQALVTRELSASHRPGRRSRMRSSAECDPGACQLVSPSFCQHEQEPEQTVYLVLRDCTAGSSELLGSRVQGLLQFSKLTGADTGAPSHAGAREPKLDVLQAWSTGAPGPWMAGVFGLLLGIGWMGIHWRMSCATPAETDVSDAHVRFAQPCQKQETWVWDPGTWVDTLTRRVSSQVCFFTR